MTDPLILTADHASIEDVLTFVKHGRARATYTMSTETIRVVLSRDWQFGHGVPQDLETTRQAKNANPDYEIPRLVEAFGRLTTTTAGVHYDQVVKTVDTGAAGIYHQLEQPAHLDQLLKGEPGQVPVKE